jgi:hypothetical protein
MESRRHQETAVADQPSGSFFALHNIFGSVKRRENPENGIE